MLRFAWCSRTALIVVVFATLVPAGAYSQSTASISGVVKDTGGAVLPGVTVTVKNDATGQSEEVTTDGEGRYQVTALGAGSYSVSAALSGFKTAAAKSVSVAPGQPVADERAQAWAQASVAPPMRRPLHAGPGPRLSDCSAPT